MVETNRSNSLSRSIDRQRSILTGLTTRLPVDEIARVADWAARPMRLLDDLHRLATRSLGGDGEATSLLVARLDAHHQKHRRAEIGSRIGEGGSPARIPVGFGPSTPCGSSIPGLIGDIGVSLVVAMAKRPDERDRLLDSLVELGDCTGNFEGLNDAIDRGDIDAALDRIDALRERGNFGIDAGVSGIFPDGGPIDGPIGGPDICPPVIPDLCLAERDACFANLIDLLKSPLVMPDGSHVHADGIDAVSSSGCAGDQIVISGSGFGPTQPPNVDVIIVRETSTRGRFCEPAAVNSWRDDEIVLTAPLDVISGCIGFLDRDELVRQRDNALQWNLRIGDLNALATCLHNGPIQQRIPLPSTSDCPPCFLTNRLLAGAPEIRHFRAEIVRGGRVTDRSSTAAPAMIEPGDDLRLSWNISNATRTTVERTSSSGPSFGTSITVDDPPGNTLFLGTAAHDRPELWTYKVTATNVCGMTEADVAIVATRDPSLTVGTYELTQCIQDPAGSVALVARKRTVLRVILNHALDGFDGDVLLGVTGRLDVFNKNGAYFTTLHPINGSPNASAMAGSTIDVVAFPNRMNVDDTLNFLLPAALCQDTITLRVSVSQEGYGASPAHPSSGIDSRAVGSRNAVTFQPRTPLSFSYFRIPWRGSDGTLRTPTAADCRATLGNALQLIAAPVGVIVEHPDSPLTVAGPHTSDEMEDLLDDFDFRHRCEISDAIIGLSGFSRNFGYCFDYNPSTLEAVNGTFWALMPGSFFRGKAADIPASTFATPARSADRWSTDNLDLKAAHEITHCLDQRHIELCGAEGGDDPDTLSSRSAVVDVGFDIPNNRTVVGATDLMSYCSTRWTHPQRWARVFGYVGRGRPT